MITASQLRAARALLDIAQKTLVEMAGVSLPTIQRMEASQGMRGVVDRLMKVINALNRAGIELLRERVCSGDSGGVRFRHADTRLGRPN
ncbi:transcriptional regulator [Mesorhizobium sp. M0152]|uniref:helix-turn-helix domain-containing protein n=1 Tax=unclassified Mesorhizobium TaxID=325217 RepID=UPI00333DA6F1